jgi:hypothetical protein
MNNSMNPSSWSIKDVGLWLKNIDLDQYTRSFETERVTGDFLLQYVDDDEVMTDLGIEKKLHRKRLSFELQKISKLENRTDNRQDSLQRSG